jgi:carboxyl-terminal processing protease
MRKKIIFGIIFVVGIFLINSVAVTVAQSEKDKARKRKDDLFRQVELFSDALAIINTDYVDEVPPKDLIYGALKGMLASLDPHSQFMDPDTFNELKVDTEGKFGGLGIEITVKDGLLTVITPIEDTPAWKAGIQSNDRIVKINNDLTRDLTLSEAVKKMRGKPGEAVTLTIFRESEKKILEFKIIRDIIVIQDIKGARILEDGIAYIRLVEFRENSAQTLTTTLENLTKEGMNALILDLRNNPGGLLDSAVKVVEKFVEKDKLIVYTKGRKGAQNLEFVSHESRPILNLPMVVLINAGSASGSEIVAGCLQDYKRAIVVGIKSFGKGSVQTLVPLSDGSALRLTTSKYFTPSGKLIHGKGVVPDIVVEEGKIELKKENAIGKVDEVFEKIEEKEHQLPEAAKPEKQGEEKSGIKEEKKDEKKDEALQDYKTDNQLVRAVDVLKAIKIYKIFPSQGTACVDVNKDVKK